MHTMRNTIRRLGTNNASVETVEAGTPVHEQGYTAHLDRLFSELSVNAASITITDPNGFDQVFTVVKETN